MLPGGGGMVPMPSVTSTLTEALPSLPTQGSQVPWLRPGLLGGRWAQPLWQVRGRWLGPGLPRASWLLGGGGGGDEGRCRTRQARERQSAHSPGPWPMVPPPSRLQPAPTRRGKEGTDSEWPETSLWGSQGSTSLVSSPPRQADSDSRENSNPGRRGKGGGGWEWT